MATRSVSMATYWTLAAILACAGVVAGDETPTDCDTGMDEPVELPTPTRSGAPPSGDGAGGRSSGNASLPARRDDKRCGSEESGKPPFVREFLKLEDETAKLRHLRTWNPQTPEQVEQNCLSETHAFHFNSLIKLSLLHHAAEDEVDCVALADNLNEAFSSSSRADPANWNMGTGYAAVYRMFDVVVEHICPDAPRVSCGGLGCPPDFRQGAPVPQGL